MTREDPLPLAQHRVFGGLDAPARTAWAPRFARERHAAGVRIADAAALGERLYWLLEGRVSLRRAGSVSTVSLAAGELFGAGAAPFDSPAWQAHADTEVELAVLHAQDVAALRSEQPVAGLFLAAPAATAPRRSADPYLGLMTTPVAMLLKRPPVTLPPDASVLQGAQTMRDERVSALLLVEAGRLVGLVTDRDLRNRALAAGLDPALPLRHIATAAPMTVQITQPAFETLMLMARHHIHHVPVLDGARPAGMVTTTDITQRLGTSAVAVTGEIHRQTDIAGLATAAARVGEIQAQLAAADATAYSTGHIVTAITDALTLRLLQLGEARLGPPPVDYAWVAAGSQARNEQAAKSDQDNCLVLADSYDEAADGAYFEALANFVNDGLDACGYVYCPGEMMARTDTWRQPRQRWADYFQRWTDKPEPKALMLTCVFFDLRLVHGRAALLDELRREVLRRTQANRIFLAHMVGNALKHRPALTMFGGIATQRGADGREVVDLKHSGIVPIVDLARVYALAGGHAAVNTSDRLAVAAEGREISAQGARDLRDALEFLAVTRIRHQARQRAAGQPPDNLLVPGELSNFERSQMKDAFGVVQTLQSVLAQRYR